MARKFEKDEEKLEKKNSGGRNRRPHSHPKKDSIRKDLKDERLNDPNWYFTNAELAEQASQLSFQSVMGLEGIEGYEVPTILRIDLNPCPGSTYKGVSYYGNPAMGTSCIPVDISGQKAGINQAASKLYTLLGTFTGRVSAYAPQDVAIMLLAISSVAELSEHIRRMFGLALTYNGRNRSIPQGLLRSMNIDVDDFIKNIAVYRMRYNAAMTRINQIPLLDNIGFIKKSRDIYQYIYTDSESSMAQMFYYAPRTVWVIDEDSDSNGSILVPEPITKGTRKTVGSLLGILENMITHLLESSTLNLIYADILNMSNKVKAPTWQFDYLAENYVVMPVFNRNALLQLHNLRVVGEPIEGGDWIPDGPYKKAKPTIPAGTTGSEMIFTEGNYVVCDPANNSVVFNPLFKGYNYWKWQVDMDTPNPNVTDRLESLRFTSSPSVYYMPGSIINGSADTKSYNILLALSDHYVVNLTIFGNASGTNDGYTVSTSDSVNQLNSGNLTVQESFAHLMANLSQFDWAPMLITSRYNHTEEVSQVHGDLNFYTKFDFEYLSRLNDLIYMGLFDFRV